MTLKELVENLNDNPTEANWQALARKMNKGKAKYYRIFYSSGTGVKQGRAQAYAVLYDAKHRSMFRLPIHSKAGKKLESVMEYLKGLALNKSAEEQPAMKQSEERERIMQKLKSLGYM